MLKKNKKGLSDNLKSQKSKVKATAQSEKFLSLTF